MNNKKLLKNYVGDLKRFSDEFMFDLEKAFYIRTFVDEKTTAKNILNLIGLEPGSAKIIVLYQWSEERYKVAQILDGDLDYCYFNNGQVRPTYTKSDVNDARKYCEKFIVIYQLYENQRKRRKQQSDYYERIKDKYSWERYDHSDYCIENFQHALRERLHNYKINKEKEKLSKFDGEYFEEYVSTSLATIMKISNAKTIDMKTSDDIYKMARFWEDIAYVIKDIEHFKKSNYSSVYGYQKGFELAQRKISEAFEKLAQC